MFSACWRSISPPPPHARQSPPARCPPSLADRALDQFVVPHVDAIQIASSDLARAAACRAFTSVPDSFAAADGTVQLVVVAQVDPIDEPALHLPVAAASRTFASFVTTFAAAERTFHRLVFLQIDLFRVVAIEFALAPAYRTDFPSYLDEPSHSGQSTLP
jgi:hypothetical protein